MTVKTTTAGAAIALIFGSASAGAADFGDMVSFHGFGTAGIMHSSEDRADFVGSRFHPEGAGFSRDWDMRPDTLLGGQLNLKFNDKFSAVVQAVAQHQHDKTFTPYIEWANIKYQVTDNFEIRAGRIVIPSFLISQSRFVGFANPWVRPPQEVYFMSPITNSDGLDTTYSFRTGGVKNTVVAHWGTSKPKIPAGRLNAKSTWGVQYSIEFGDVKVRAGYLRADVDFEVPALYPLINGVDSLATGLRAAGFTAAADQAGAMYERYRLDDVQFDIFMLGVSYDPGKYFLMAEGLIFKGDAIARDTQAAYATAGYRIKAFTPYVTVATHDPDIVTEPGITTAGLPAPLADAAAGLNAGVNGVLTAFTTAQSSASVGVRWDFRSGAALKVQYDRLSLQKNTQGLLSNPQPGFESGEVDLISLSVDFTF